MSCVSRTQLFFLCHTPRWVVYLDEFFNLESLRLSVASESEQGPDSVGKYGLQSVARWKYTFIHLLHSLFEIFFKPQFFPTELPLQSDCNNVSIWALVTASVAAFLLTVNASVNFFIYAYMCASFRSILLRLCKQYLG